MLIYFERRSKDDIYRLFDLAEQWLEEYKEWKLDALSKNPQYIGQPNWHDNCWL